MAMTFKDYTAEYKGRIFHTGSKEDLEFLYIRERLSTTEISKVFDNRLSNKTVARRLKKFGIPARQNKGKDNPAWTGGVKPTKDGYILIHTPSHPNANSQGYVLEHRLVMEKSIGRYLKPTELVHHINKIRDDNEIENLKLMESNSAHARLENQYRERNELGMYI